MKQVQNVWLPDTEIHFTETLSNLKDPRYPALDVALGLLDDKHRRIAIDIGAHVGLWSRWLVQEFDDVIAFEPVEEYAELFKLNMGYDNWTLFPIALGERCSHVSMKTFPENTGQAYVDGEGKIEMQSLDFFDFSRVDMIKIDVEGYELQVVKGAEKTIRENKPIVIIEQRGCEVTNFGSKKDEALDWLLSLGMKKLDRIHYDCILGWKP